MKLRRKQLALCLLPALLSVVILASPAKAATVWQGYYDFEVVKPHNGGAKLLQHHLSTFIQHNTSIFTLFGEIEYEYAPQFYGNGSSAYAPASNYGKFLVETVWANVEFNKLFQLRGGYLLVPTWWQANHYPNIVLTYNRPQIIKTIFPGADNAFMLHGETGTSMGTFGYKAWLGNGAEVSPSELNADAAFSKGFRGEARDFLSFMDTSELGIMYAEYPTNGVFGLKSYGVDLLLEKAGFGLNAAYHQNTVSTATTKGGYFLIPSYKYQVNRLHSVTPYVSYDVLQKTAGNSTKVSPGIRYGYGTDVSVKAEYTSATSETGATSSQVAAQFAYYFN